jgi:hypothetical protein
METSERFGPRPPFLELHNTNNTRRIGEASNRRSRICRIELLTGMSLVGVVVSEEMLDAERECVHARG